MNSTENTPPSQPDEAGEKIREVHHHHYHRRGPGFNFGRLLFGLIVVAFGLAFLARNMGWLPYDLYVDWSLFWPIVVVLIGLSLMSGRGWFGLLFGVAVTLLVLAVIGAMFWGRSGFMSPGTMRNWSGDWRGEAPQVQSQDFSIDKEPEAKRANISISGGAGLITVQGGTDNLVEGKLVSNISAVSTSSKIFGERQEVAIEASGKGGVMMSRGWRNDLDVLVTHQIAVELSVDGGAASLALDLTRVVAESVKINTGASKVDLSLGDKAVFAKVDINAGASSVEIELPKSLGAKVNMNSALTSSDLPDFEKIGDNAYATKDYDKAEKKVELNLELGVSSVRINLK